MNWEDYPEKGNVMLTFAIISTLLVTAFCIWFSGDLRTRATTFGVPSPLSLASDLPALFRHILETDYRWTEIQGCEGSIWYQGELEVGFGRKYIIVWSVLERALDLIEIRRNCFWVSTSDHKVLNKLPPEAEASLTGAISAKVTEVEIAPEEEALWDDVWAPLP